MPRRKRRTRRPPARPGRREAGTRPHSRRGRRRAAAERVEALLTSARDRKDDSRDHRRPERHWAGYRTLDVKRDRELFAGLVALDFDYLMGLRFAVGPRTLMDLMPQSVVGRAQNGHGWFSDEYGTSLRFPDATFERVLSVLEKTDPNLRGETVRRRRTDMLHRFGTWLLERLEQPQLELVTADGPLLGVEFLADRAWDTRAFLKGMVLAGHMDDWSFRLTSMLRHKRTFSGLPYLIGGGEILVVDPARLDSLGLGDTGQSVFTDDHLQQLRDLGAIVDDAGEHRFPARDQAYFRRRLGDGVCDDLAMILVGARHGLDAMMGAFVMDALDTYDKYLLKITRGGFDGWLAGRIQERFLAREGKPLVGDEEILDLIHFAAKRNDPPVPLSSSHRRLIQYERNATTPTVLNHWRFLQGDSLDDIKLGFSRVPAREFYRAARDRLSAVEIDVPEPTYLAPRKGRGRPLPGA